MSNYEILLEYDFYILLVDIFQISHSYFEE